MGETVDYWHVTGSSYYHVYEDCFKVRNAETTLVTIDDKLSICTWCRRRSKQDVAPPHMFTALKTLRKLIADGVPQPVTNGVITLVARDVPYILEVRPSGDFIVWKPK